MFYVSEIMNNAPTEYSAEIQKKVYQALGNLNISYDRVDTDAAVEMETCFAIDEKLGVPIVKTLFLCNRQQTQFYLFITCGDKPFRSKDFSAALGIPRVSFAPAELLEQMMGSKIGGTSVLGMLLDSSRDVKLVFDRDTVNNEWFGCSDGTAYSFMKIKTDDLLHKLLPSAHRTYQIIALPDTTEG